MKKIKLTRGKYALVDNEDYEGLNKHKWCYANSYAIRVTYIKRKGTRVKMQNVIMNPPTGFVVDHIDRNQLNNKKSNLRICKTWQNNLNRTHTKKGKTSRYRGVSWSKRSCRYICKIRLNKKRHYIGHFDSQIKAARAYDEMAKKLHGEFAILNFKV